MQWKLIYIYDWAANCGCLIVPTVCSVKYEINCWQVCQLLLMGPHFLWGCVSAQQACMCACVRACMCTRLTFYCVEEISFALSWWEKEKELWDKYLNNNNNEVMEAERQMEPFILHNHVVKGARKLIGQILCLLDSRGPTSPSVTASTGCSLRYNNSSFFVVQRIISNSCRKNVHHGEALSCPGEPHWHQQGCESSPHPKSPRWWPIHFHLVAHISTFTQKSFWLLLH